MMDIDDLKRNPLRWMLEVAKARNCEPKARTVNLKFSKATLDTWQHYAEAALDVEHNP